MYTWAPDGRHVAFISGRDGVDGLYTVDADGRHASQTHRESVTQSGMAAPTVKSAIIIGASSGIGRALAVALSLDGYRVGVVARRTDLLAQLRAELRVRV